MRFSVGFSAVLAPALLAACAASGQSGGSTAGTSARSLAAPVSLAQPWMLPAGVQRLRLTPVAMRNTAPSGGIYASQYDGGSCGTDCQIMGDVNGYPNPNKAAMRRLLNNPPVCSIGVYFVNGIGTDTAGNLMIPGYFDGSDSLGTGEFTLNVYKGPRLCGGKDHKLLGILPDTTGQPGDAASMHAARAKIVVGEITNYDTHAGDVVVCTIASMRCSSPIESSNITGNGYGVAVDGKGDCWMSAETAGSASATLAYWKGCTGSGQTASGFQNEHAGGLFIDNDGNLGAIDFGGSLYVYKGCNPKCTLVGGPFTLEGASFFGNLNGSGTQLAVGDYANGSVDVYDYSPSGISFQYSFNNGLVQADGVESGIFSPANE
jgi:hypothetical protein